MCGRYTLAASTDGLVEAFDVPVPAFEWAPRYNIAPSQQAPIVAEDSRGRRVGLLTWGLAPGWMDDPGPGFVNARSESVHTKPAFRDGFERRRCLVPADGFYEWQKQEGAKVPHWLHPAAGGVVSFAGLWDSWSRPGAEPRHTFAILTTEANDEVSAVHDRMPVVVPADARHAWLAKDADPAALRALLRPAPDGTFAVRRVSTRVNKPVEDDAGLIEAM
jgi:putative SOS response-associated peptidase YedK